MAVVPEPEGYADGFAPSDDGSDGSEVCFRTHAFYFPVCSNAQYALRLMKYFLHPVVVVVSWEKVYISSGLYFIIGGFRLPLTYGCSLCFVFSAGSFFFARKIKM